MFWGNRYGLALTLRVRGEDDTLSSNTLWSVCNLFALSPALHSSLKPSLLFGFKVTFRFGFRLFVFVFALHSVVKPTHASVFITTLRFIQTIASLKGFDRTTRSITLLVFTPRVLHARQAFRIALVKHLKGVRSAIVLAETTSCLVVSARTKAILPHIVLHITL